MGCTAAAAAAQHGSSCARQTQSDKTCEGGLTNHGCPSMSGPKFVYNVCGAERHQRDESEEQRAEPLMLVLILFYLYIFFIVSKSHEKCVS